MESSLGFLAFAGACLVVASSGAIFRPGEWYEGLSKPSWRPPNWLFGPAWAVLYLMIAISGWLVWSKAGFSGAAGALAVYGVSLLFNGLWSALFFGMRRPDYAFVDLILLWLSIVAMIVLFRPIDPLASNLLLPYLAWVSFAGVLNFSMWQRNKPYFDGQAVRDDRQAGMSG